MGVVKKGIHGSGILALLLLALPCGAQVITEFDVPTAHSGLSAITRGPDGNFWFTEAEGNRIGRITPAGVVTEFPLRTAGSPVGIAAGPDGNLWFAEFVSGAIGRISPSGNITEFPLPQSNSGPFSIAAGPDGNLWFTEKNTGRIGRITTSGSVTEYDPPTASTEPSGIAAGPDGALWFSEPLAYQVGRITTSGAITEYPLPETGRYPFAVTAGPDGKTWLTETPGNGSRIAKIAAGGAVAEFDVGVESLPGIAAGSDGNLGFTESVGSIGRLTPSGSVAHFLVHTTGSDPQGIVSSSDGKIWFAESGRNQIARLDPAHPCSAPAAPSLSIDGRSSETLSPGASYHLEFSNTLGQTAGDYEIRISRDGGTTFSPLATTGSTSYTGTVAASDSGQTLIFAVVAGASCGSELYSGSASSRVSLVVSGSSSASTPPASSSTASCKADASTACLNGGRFKVQVNWAASQLNPPQSGEARAVPLTGDTGYFWFFSSNNVELMIKVVDGSKVNGHFWVFYGALSNIAYTINITDTATGASRTYANPQGTLASIADTAAF